MAIGVAKAIIDLGYKIPQDISLVGYDDIEIAEYFSPPLTTVRQKTIEIGETAADLLIRKIEGEDAGEDKHLVLEPELVVRQTT